jgi:signal transduction histidine kinase
MDSPQLPGSPFFQLDGGRGVLHRSEASALRAVKLLSMSSNFIQSTIEGDATRFQQVVWNLLKNASKFTPAGGTISVTSAHADGRFVVEVQDSGVGIAPEVLPRIFQAFEQGGADVGREFGGLGLAISKATVEAHGGVLKASSPGLGQGATFSVEIPLEGEES